MKLSIIIPCYNHESFVDAAIESALAVPIDQTEIIVVDGGSTDKSVEVIKTTITGKRITFIALGHSGTASIPRNVGIKRASGEYIFPLDSDDRLDPAGIVKLYQLLEEHKKENPYRVAHGWTQKFGKRTDIWKTKSFSPETLLYQNQLGSSSLYTRVLWEMVGGYNELIHGYEDWCFWISALGKSTLFLHLPEVVRYHRIHRTETETIGEREHEWQIARIILRNAKLYDTDAIYWAIEYLKANVKAPEKRAIHNIEKEQYPFIVAKLILAYPKLYTKEEGFAAKYLLEGLEDT